MRRKLTCKRAFEANEPRIVSPHWKLDAMENLPEPELRSWYDNMEAGLDVARDELSLQYKVGRVLFSFRLTPKRIWLPDGSTRIVRTSDVGAADDSSEAVNPVEQITRHILRRVKNPDVLTFEYVGAAPEPLIKLPGAPVDPDAKPPNVITYGLLLTELIEGQFEALAENGVERSGFFVEGLKGMHHMGNPVEEHDAITDAAMEFVNNLRKRNL
ncbi:MAG: hypothetical protein ABH834_03010 [Candidatus Altiarchaeota archaeon]